MAEEHVSAPQGPSGGGGQPDDASKKIEELTEMVAQLQQGLLKRDEALQRMQSDKDKLATRLERERKQRERVETARLRDVQKLPDTQQTEYLKSVAAQEHQKATKFELAHQYDLDPTELEGDFPTREAMHLHAIELAQAKGSKDLDAKLDQLTAVVTQLSELQQKQQEDPPVQPDPGGRHASQGAPPDALEEFDKLIAEYRRIGRHDLATQAMLAKIHRDPSKVLGSAISAEELPPELQAKLRR